MTDKREAPQRKGFRLSGVGNCCDCLEKPKLHRWFTMLLSAQSLDPPWWRAAPEDSWPERQWQIKPRARSQTPPDHAGARRIANCSSTTQWMQKAPCRL